MDSRLEYTFTVSQKETAPFILGGISQAALIMRNPKHQSIGRPKSYRLILATLEICSTEAVVSDGRTGRKVLRPSTSRYRLINWTISRVFEFHTFGNWQFSFRTYRIITRDDPVHQATVSGDLQLVFELCAQGKATPHDITADGWSLLHVIYHT